MPPSLFSAMEANLLSSVSIEFDDFAVDGRDPLEHFEKVTAGRHPV